MYAITEKDRRKARKHHMTPAASIDCWTFWAAVDAIKKHDPVLAGNIAMGRRKLTTRQVVVMAEMEFSS